MSKYKEITDLLDNGIYKIKVLPSNEYDKDKREFIKGSHKSGTSEKGFKWWMYTVMQYESDGEWKDLKYDLDGKSLRVSIFGNEKNKEILDQGEIECVIKDKLDKSGQVEAYIDADTRQPVIKKSVFYNKIGYTDRVSEELKEATKNTRSKLYDEDEIDETDIPL